MKKKTYLIDNLKELLRIELDLADYVKEENGKFYKIYDYSDINPPSWIEKEEITQEKFEKINTLTYLIKLYEQRKIS